ncbi:suppressor of fused domain protein [Brumimicrobium aurantiacum]|uniref:Suppressor of fused domain protein n=1 Tax=Brumimicrobium aurantiacum TaxID=1737063 RepID=A0A3E1F159_9FLAO|nr:suppressor of fused domain protein [Brumimicrobium aurantiacum]RFC55554.1 suppressor of fused domain protein [Brumimicrobium aurantiacum]
MSELKKALSNRFGEHRVHDYIESEDRYIDLLQIDLEKKFPVTIICTHGLSDYEMPVIERYKDRKFTELFFCLPGYWDLNDKENPNMMWPLEVIQKLTKNVIENKTWYGPGHTIANGNPSVEISETMKQDHFLLADPIEFEDYLAPINIDGKTVHFLAIIPLFHKEYEQKTHKGYRKWIKKFRSRNGNEILDDYRKSIYKSRWKR